MSALARKINIGVASCAMAAAATLTPTTVAQAQPAPAPISALGGQLGQLGDSDCVTVSGAPCATAFVAAAAGPSASATPGGIVRSIFQNDLWWIGKANPNPPARSNILVFTPLSMVPGFLKPAYSWFTKNLNFEACFLGASVKLGPYGTTTLSVGRGCK
ncbi:hypothetical protein [Mycolicibacterium diernhoferi]|nr:hypothetical protein [Mycolicibacterium diernhoferi]QYL23744.1 hypothetical protein K0O62_05435 [Mycolicibacterium diernhoferi]